MEGDGGGLHGYAALLLVGPRVEVADLAGEFGGYDAVGGEEGVGEGGLAVVLVEGSVGVLRGRGRGPGVYSQHALKYRSPFLSVYRVIRIEFFVVSVTHIPHTICIVLQADQLLWIYHHHFGRRTKSALEGKV